MVTLVCLQCGDRGWDNAFVYCVKCVNQAVHRYCLDEVPKIYDKMNEYVRWVCDDCEAESQKGSHPNSDAKTQRKKCSEQIEVDSTITLNKKRISPSAESVENGHCKSGVGLQSPHKELVRSKDSELVGHCRPSRTGTNSNDDCSPMVLDKNESRCPINCSQLHGAKNIEVASDGPSGKEKLRKLNDLSLLVTTNRSPSAHAAEFDEDAPLANLSPLSTNLKKDIPFSLDNFAEQRCENIPTLRPLKEGNNTIPEREAEPIEESSLVSCNTNDADRFAEQRCENIPTLTPHKEGNDTDHERDAAPIEELSDNSAEQRCENMPILQPCKGNNTNHDREAEPMQEPSLVSCNTNDVDSIPASPRKAQPIVVAGENRVRAKPLVDPIWRGNFNVVNQDNTVEGLAAHLSSKACRMVYNEASLLPMSLHLEMLPRAVVWPKSFEKSEPTDDNIAMYIFPTDTRYASSFDLLVTKMTQQELAMRTLTENAELMIFTSKELPLSYWRFRGKCYLWGVFRKKPSLSSRAT